MQKIIFIASFVVAAAIYNLNPVPVSGPENSYNIEEAVKQSHAATIVKGSNAHRCFPEISGQGDLHTIYDYSTRKQEFSDGSRAGIHHVDIEPTSKPVLIGLSSYEPIVWQLNVKPGAKIAGILLTSYHESLVTGAPEGVSIGKTFLKGIWSDDETDCYLPGQLKHIGNQMRDAEKRSSWVRRAQEERPFRFDYYHNFKNFHNIENFEEAVLKVANFRHVDNHKTDEKIHGGRFVISDKGKQAKAAAISQAKADLRMLGKPSTALELNVRNIREKPRKFTNIDTFEDDVTSMGYLKDGTEEYAFYCKYRSALQRLKGMSGEHSCHFHVRYKYENAFVVLGNFSFPKDMCLDVSTVFLLPPGVQKPYIPHCTASADAILYLDLVDDLCLGGISACEAVREERDRTRRAEFKRRD